MSSLRIRQKRAREQQMLDAARTLFLANGFFKTSIESIAEAAQVGVATVYTYFESKEGLAAALIRKDNSQIIEEAGELVGRLPGNTAESIIAVVDVLKDFNKYISATLLNEFVIQGRQGGPVSEALSWSHARQVNLVSQVLDRGRRDGEISPSLDTDLAAALIIDLMDRHLGRMMTAENPAVYADQLAAFVRLLFQDWSVRRQVLGSS